jgi:WD repeat-containing protein 68
VKFMEDNQELNAIGEFSLDVPASKVMWIPDLDVQKPDILASVEDNLKIWQIFESGEIRKIQQLDNSPKPDFCAPLVTFDWCPTNLDLIVTGSIDSTCSVWSLGKESCVHQFVAHDKEVYDVSYAPEEHIIGTVGGDGTFRCFDTRNLEKGTILYEGQNSTSPLLRLAWNKRNPNYVALVEMDHYNIVLVDIRKPLKVCTLLESHKKALNSICWSPDKENLLCSGGDDCEAYIWDTQTGGSIISKPVLTYRKDVEVSNVAWGILQSNWVGLTAGNNLELLKI